MTDKLQSLSFARMLTLVTSVLGLALMAIAFAVSETAWVPLLALPFLLGLITTIIEMKRRTRGALLWLAAISGGLVAAIMIFNGIGFFLLAIVIAYIWAARAEDETPGRPG